MNNHRGHTTCEISSKGKLSTCKHLYHWQMTVTNHIVEETWWGEKLPTQVILLQTTGYNTKRIFTFTHFVKHSGGGDCMWVISYKWLLHMKNSIDLTTYQRCFLTLSQYLTVSLFLYPSGPPLWILAKSSGVGSRPILFDAAKYFIYAYRNKYNQQVYMICPQHISLIICTVKYYVLNTQSILICVWQAWLYFDVWFVCVVCRWCEYFCWWGCWK